MEREIVVFHSALGLRPGLSQWVDRLRTAGHHVHAPDLYDGEVFDNAARAITKIQELGFDEILLRSRAAVAPLSPDLVYIGFSNGGASAELLGATRPGARGIVLIGAPLPIRDLGWTVWPEGVPVQIHFGERDSRRNERVIAEFASQVHKAGATSEEHLYPTAMHHFADPDWAGYNSPAAEDGSIAVGALALISETRCDVDQAPGRHLELLSDQSSLWVIEAVNGNIRMLINRGRGYQNLRYLLLKAKRMAVANIEFISVQTVKKAA